MLNNEIRARGLAVGFTARMPRSIMRVFNPAGRRAMPLSHLEHYLIQTEDLEATKYWYVRVLGMRGVRRD